MNKRYVKSSRQVGIAFGASLSIYLRGLLLIPILTRALGTAEYGAWVQMFACTELLLGIAVLGLDSAFVRFLPSRRREGHLTEDFVSILSGVGVVGAALALLGIYVSDGLSRVFLGTTEMTVFFQLSFGLLPVSAMAKIILTYFRASQQIALYSFLMMFESFGFVGLAIFLVIEGFGLLGVIGGLLVLRAMICIIGCFITVRQIGFKSPKFSGSRSYLAFGLPLVPLGIFTWVTNISDRYVLAAFHGPEEAGIYSVSYGLGSVVGFLFSPLFFVIGPVLTELWESNDLETLKEHLKYCQKYTLLVAVPLTVVLTVYSGPILEFVATSEFLASPSVMCLTAVGIIVMNLGALVEIALNLALKTRIIPVIYAACAFFNLVANMLAVPAFGMIGAAATTFLTYFLQLVLVYTSVKRFFPFAWNFSFLNRSLLAALPMIACLLYFREQGMLGNIGGFFLGVGIYIIGLSLVGGFEKREWILAKSLVSLSLGGKR